MATSFSAASGSRPPTDAGRRLPLAVRWAIVGLAAVAGTILSRQIRIPYSNPEGIVGPLDLIRFHPLNNLLHYVVSVTTPAITWWILLAIWPIPRPEQDAAATPGQRPSDEADRGGRWPFFGVAALVLGWSVCHCVSRLAVVPRKPLLDFFHDGEWLTPALQYTQGQGLWTGSFFCHGLFTDVLSPLASWRWFGAESIGGPRLLHVWLWALVPLTLAGLLVTVGLLVRRAKGFRSAATLMALLMAAYAAGELAALHTQQDRHVILMVGVTALLLAIGYDRLVLWGIAGLIVPLAFMYRIDQGGFLLLISLGLLPLPLLLRNGPDRQFWITRLTWAMGFAGGWSLLAAALGTTEIGAFCENLWYWVRYKDYLDSVRYSTRAALPNALTPALIMVELLVAAIWFPEYRRGRQVVVASVHAALVLAAFFMFRYGLGRSDRGHVVLASSFAYLGAGLVAWLILERAAAKRPRLGPAVAVGLCLVAVSPVVLRSGTYWRLLPSMPARAAAYVERPDATFLDEAARRALPRLQEAFAEQRHLFIYPSEPAWYYLLRKPCVTRFYVTWFAAPTRFQHEVVSDLERHQPQRILYSSPVEWSNAIDGIDNRTRFPVLHQYIQEHYQPAEDIEGWQLYSRIR